MGQARLQVTLRTRGDFHTTIRLAGRIEFDGGGAVRIADPATGAIETFPLAGVEIVSIQFGTSAYSIGMAYAG
jgi:hypothetical protein